MWFLVLAINTIPFSTYVCVYKDLILNEMGCRVNCVQESALNLNSVFSVAVCDVPCFSCRCEGLEKVCRRI